MQLGLRPGRQVEGQDGGAPLALVVGRGTVIGPMLRCRDPLRLSRNASLTSFQMRAENARTVMLRFGWVPARSSWRSGPAGS